MGHRRHSSWEWSDHTPGATASGRAVEGDFQPYDLLEELARRQLFHPAGCATTPPVLFRQAVDDYVESWHSRNGFSRDRMSASRALEFDARVREIVMPYA